MATMLELRYAFRAELAAELDAQANAGELSAAVHRLRMYVGYPASSLRSKRLDFRGYDDPVERLRAYEVFGELLTNDQLVGICDYEASRILTNPKYAPNLRAHGVGDRTVGSTTHPMEAKS
jgi:hypothetical protein